MSFWNDERIALMVQWRAAGMSTSQIARRFGNGCTKNVIIGKCRRLGVARSDDTDNWSPEDTATAERLFREGQSITRIAEALGRSRPSVDNKLRRMARPAPRPKPNPAPKPKPVAARPVSRQPLYLIRRLAPPTPPALPHNRLQCVGPGVPYDLDHRGCAWLLSAGRPWIACAHPAMPESPYCAAHHAASVYVRPQAA